MSDGLPHETTLSGLSAEGAATLRVVTGLMAAVVSLTFLFGFGNVWSLALRLGVPTWVAPLVAPAVDLSVLGLLLGIRHLAVHGALPEELRPARRLLVISSGMTLALNTADPLIAGELGKAAFDAVGPVLLIGWAEVGPGLLQALAATAQDSSPPASVTSRVGGLAAHGDQTTGSARASAGQAGRRHDGNDLVGRARLEDARHWETYRRPISAETLRKRLRVGSAQSRMLVAVLRSDTLTRLPDQAPNLDKRVAHLEV